MVRPIDGIQIKNVYNSELRSTYDVVLTVAVVVSASVSVLLVVVTSVVVERSITVEDVVVMSVVVED